MQWYLCRILGKSVQKVILNIYYVWQSACTERNEDETFGTKLRKFVLTASATLLFNMASAQADRTYELKRCNLNETQPVRVDRQAHGTASYKTQLVGFLYYADSWNTLEGTTPMGIYTIDTDPGSMPQPFARIGLMNSHCNGGAVLAGDTFWYIWRQTAEGSDIDISQLYSYNIRTGQAQNHGVVPSTLASTNDHAWDSTEDKIYGQYSVDGSRKLCVVDYLNQTLTPVGDCYTFYGLAFDATVTTYMGIDLPGAPKDIVLTDAGNGQLKLSWQAPSAGANGGYCDPANLTYNVYAVQNGYAVAFKNGIRGTELTFADADYYYSNQFPKTFGVSASNSAGEGGVYRSSEVMVGQTYSYPFSESWKAGNASHEGWYRMSNGEKGWTPAANYSSDNDNGCISFEAAKDGDLSYLALGKVNTTYAAKPKLFFDYYAVPGADMFLLPEINLAYSGTYVAADTIRFASLGGESGWRTVVLDIAPYTRERSYISVRFLGKGSALYPMHIDNVRILDSDETPNLGFGAVGGIIMDDGDVKYYDLNGFEVARPQKGSVYIVRSSSGKVSKVIM